MSVTTWIESLRDSEEQPWTFQYNGGTHIRIRPSGAPDWTNIIDLNYHGLKPDQVTRTWLDQRAAEWITDRNNDLASGNL